MYRCIAIVSQHALQESEFNWERPTLDNPFPDPIMPQNLTSLLTCKSRLIFPFSNGSFPSTWSNLLWLRFRSCLELSRLQVSASRQNLQAPTNGNSHTKCAIWVIFLGCLPKLVYCVETGVPEAICCGASQMDVAKAEFCSATSRPYLFHTPDFPAKWCCQ